MTTAADCLAEIMRRLAGVRYHAGTAPYLTAEQALSRLTAVQQQALLILLVWRERERCRGARGDGGDT